MSNNKKFTSVFDSSQEQRKHVFERSILEENENLFLIKDSTVIQYVCVLKLYNRNAIIRCNCCTTHYVKFVKH